MLLQHPTPAPTKPTAPAIDPESPAEIERRRIAAMSGAERWELEKARREAERQAERDRADELERQRADLRREVEARRSAELQAVQAAWARQRDELRAAEKTLRDELVTARAELEAALTAGEVSRAVELRTRVDIADELAQRASDRLAAHMRTQPTYSSVLR